MNARLAYHHGDLRRALIAAATDLLRETQRWDFSLREVARRAGVSHNAPYSHFADKRELLAAVGVAGYLALRDHLLNACADVQDAGDALQVIGVAYIGFGRDNPAHYRLMFGQDLRADGAASPGLLAAAAELKLVLHQVVADGAKRGVFAIDSSEPAAIATAVLGCWSLVHGYTMLAIDGLARAGETFDKRLDGAMIVSAFCRSLMA